MTVPLPSQGDTSWYDWASDIHTKANAAATESDLAGKQPLDSDLTAFAALAPANGEVPVREGGTWGSAPLSELVDTTPITAADFGLAQVQAVRAYASATGQVVTAGAYPVYLDLNTVEFNDAPSLFTIDLTNDRITVAEGGVFLVSWDVNYADAAGLREAFLTKNGGNAISAAAAGAGGLTYRSYPVRLVAGDYVQIICYVEGANVSLVTNASFRCGLALTRIGL